MFIWTIQDAIGFGLLALLLLAVGLLWIVIKAESLWKKIRKPFRN